MVKYDTFIFKHKIIKIILYLLARLQALFPFVIELCYLLRALLYSVTRWDHTCTPFPSHGGITLAHHFRHPPRSQLYTVSVTAMFTLAHHFRHPPRSQLYTVSVTAMFTLAHHFRHTPSMHNLALVGLADHCNGHRMDRLPLRKSHQPMAMRGHQKPIKAHCDASSPLADGDAWSSKARCDARCDEDEKAEGKGTSGRGDA